MSVISISKPVARGRLMLCNIGRLGDTILRNSILDSAFRTYATVDYICGPGNIELIRDDSRLNEVTVFEKSLSGWTTLVKAALRRRYDAYIDLKDHCSKTSLAIALLFRSRIKTGCNSRHWRPFHRDVSRLHQQDLHQIEIIQQIGNLAGLNAGEYQPSLQLPADSINWFERNHELEKPFIFLNISATFADRMWPADRWVQYIQGCGFGEEFFLVNGVPKDRPIVDQLCRQLPNAVAFQPRRFMDVAAGIDKARLVVTVDTGVVHACSALNKPVLGLYNGGNPETNKPLSSQFLMVRAPAEVANMDPQEAIARTLDKLSPGSKSLPEFFQVANNGSHQTAHYPVNA